METCLGLGRSKHNLNKQQQKDLKLQDQQQQQHTQLQQFKQQTQAIITNQNYYTRQQQPKNQRHLVARGQTTNVGALKPELQQQQQQHNEESHLLRPEKYQNVQHSTTATPCTTKPLHRNTSVAATTANMQQLSLPKASNCTDDVGVQQQPQPQTISFQKNTVPVEVTPTLASTVRPTNTPDKVANTNVKTFRKINRQSEQQGQQQQQHNFQQQQHQHLLHQQQQQQLEADLDAIEVYEDPEPHVSFKGGGGLLRQTKTLGRLNHQRQHHHSIADHHDQGTHITSLQLLQLQQHQQQHDYSYAYYEPGAAMRHTNIPHAELMAGANEEEDLIPPPPNSIRALLLKGKKNKLLVSPTTRESYQSRLTEKPNHNESGATASANCSNISTPENLYEEISASSSSSSSNSMTSPHHQRATSHSACSLTRTLVEEELRRVQNRHHKTLGELNLSIETLLMPESPPNSSPTDKEPPTTAVSVTSASGQPLRLTSLSADSVCDTGLGPADEFFSPIPNSRTVSAGLLQSSCLAADLDSGFSGSSGASYIGSLRLHKTKTLMSSRSNNLSSTTIAAAGSNAAAKSQQSAFAYATQCCRSFQRANSYKGNATATSAFASSSSTAVKASATTSSCTIKHLPQIHHNTKYQQHHHHSHLNNHLHQQQQHQKSQHINDGLQNSSGFFTRASCGCRILSCAKIRAARDPDPVDLNAQPKESKARSFWNRKGWRKLPGFSTSTSSSNDPG